MLSGMTEGFGLDDIIVAIGAFIACLGIAYAALQFGLWIKRH